METLLNQEKIAFLDALLFILGTLFIVCLGTLIGTSLRPVQPNIEKLSTYESGEEPAHPAWGAFDIQFYGVGLIFLLFEVETMLLFPWALACHGPELNPAVSLAAYYGNIMLIGTSFILILMIGLLYAYKNGHFKWYPREKITYPTNVQVPEEYYKKINRYYATAAHTNRAQST